MPGTSPSSAAQSFFSPVLGSLLLKVVEEQKSDVSTSLRYSFSCINFLKPAWLKRFLMVPVKQVNSLRLGISYPSVLPRCRCARLVLSRDHGSKGVPGACAPHLIPHTAEPHRASPEPLVPYSSRACSLQAVDTLTGSHCPDSSSESQMLSRQTSK